MKRKITPRGKFYWGSLVTDINYQINSVYLTKSRKFIIKSFIGFILLTLLSLNTLILMKHVLFVVLLRKQ